MNYVIEGKPLSVNNTKAAVNVRGKLRMITTAKARTWKTAAAWSLRAQRGTIPTITGPCTLTIRVFLPTAAGDVDNYLKAILDALQDAKVFANDRQVQGIQATKEKDKDRPRVEIEVHEGAAKEAKP
jgi:Holliday junction resolvase RusA-like endonuclease